MTKKKICWITSTYLLDVDIPIVPVLQADYDIDWIVMGRLFSRQQSKEKKYECRRKPTV